MDLDEIASLRANSPAWKLLRADNAPLVLSFLGRIFVDENARSVSGDDLVLRLDDDLWALQARLGEGAYPRSAKEYLEHWASPEVGWLRKYYPAGSDVAHFDATSAVEKALSWVSGLQARSFVGTESRLNTLFELLRQMVVGAEADPDVRLADLHRRRAQLDDEIAQVNTGHVVVMGSVAQRDRYQQFTATARELLADFREVEANFRTLDRELREQIAAWSGSKGELLDEVLQSRASISESDQGQSFQSFYDFLLSHRKQTELAEMLATVQSLPAIGEPDPRMRHIHHDWLEAGERTQATVRLLSEQLRRFLDDQAWLENRRVMDLLRSIESSALKVRSEVGGAPTSEIAGVAPHLVLPMERPLYRTVVKTPLVDTGIEVADEDLDTSSLFDQFYVDPVRLTDGVRRALSQRPQIGLSQLLHEHPLEQGLAELVTYLALSDEYFKIVFDESVREELSWYDAEERHRTATLPRVTFTRIAALRDRS